MNRCWILALTLALGLLACGKDAPPVAGRLIIVGFDGMDPKLAQQWMDDGSLPNFRRLSELGSFQPLATSNPPQSPVAWSSFATGTEPGGHGIYDFLRRDPQNYNPAFSISEIIPPDDFLSLFGLELPLDEALIVNRRQGRAFWSDIEQNGGRTTVLRVPVTFPPDPVHRMMSGMGVPDLLGTQGTYTYYSTDPITASMTNSTRAVRLRPGRQGHIETSLTGPLHPAKPEAGALSVDMSLDPAGENVRITLDDTDIELAPGEWSDWVTVKFDYLKFASVTGIVRLHLLNAYPNVRLYVSPINIDPRAPVVPLSSPPDYASGLAEQHGLFYTIGMPEETWSLNEGHLSDHAYLDMIRSTLDDREMMFFDALDQRDSDVVVGVFVQTDRVAHMFYRGIDPGHPLYPETSEEARGAIHWIYREADRILARTMERMGPKDRLIVLSDHGFAPFRRSVHLNRWLADQGYLAFKDGKERSGVGFADVDWTRTRAYAVGLNSIYINRKGREADGIVTRDQASSIKQAIMDQLPLLTDPDSGDSMVDVVFDGAEMYPGNANEDAPDLVVGYQPGYRASWQTTLGSVPAELAEDNTRKWSGDHCITPEAVPGVLFTSFQPEMPIEDLPGVAEYIRQHWQSSIE